LGKTTERNEQRQWGGHRREKTGGGKPTGFLNVTHSIIRGPNKGEIKGGQTKTYYPSAKKIMPKNRKK